MSLVAEGILVAGLDLFGHLSLKLIFGHNHCQ